MPNDVENRYRSHLCIRVTNWPQLGRLGGKDNRRGISASMPVLTDDESPDDTLDLIMPAEFACVGQSIF